MFESLFKTIIWLSMSCNESEWNQLLNGPSEKRNTLEKFVRKFSTVASIKKHQIGNFNKKFSPWLWRKVDRWKQWLQQHFLRQRLFINHSSASFLGDIRWSYQKRQSKFAPKPADECRYWFQGLRKDWNETKRSIAHPVSWKCAHLGILHSTVGYMQLFSDKSQTTLSAGAEQFYLFYATLLKLSAETRQKFVFPEKTITANSPVEYGLEKESGWSFK